MKCDMCEKELTTDCFVMMMYNDDFPMFFCNDDCLMESNGWSEKDEE